DSTSPAPPGVTREGSAPDEQGSGSTPSSMEYVWDTPQETSPPGYWTSALGAGVSLASPLTTGFDTGVYAQFSTFRKARSGAGMWTWSPALALAVHVLRSPWTGKGQVASFYQTSVQASVCPHRVADGNFAWKLCATGQYGSLF